MSLIDLIEKVRQKPQYVRTRILWMCVAVCMVVITGVWIATLKYSWLNKIDDITGNDESIKKAGGQFRSVKDSFMANVGSFLGNENENDDNKENNGDNEREEDGQPAANDGQEMETKTKEELKTIKPAKLPLADEE